MNGVSLTPDSVQIQSLKDQIQILQAQIDVEKDQEVQIAQLKEQLSASLKFTEQLSKQHSMTLQTLISDHQIAIQRLNAENQKLHNQLNETNEGRGKIQKELRSASKYMAGLEERTFQANQTSLDLLRKVRDLELENQTLRDYIIDLKAKMTVYVPVKGDAVDQQMAEFINNYPERHKLKIIFVRESQGIYHFGTKRVNVRIENSRI